MLDVSEIVFADPRELMTEPAFSNLFTIKTEVLSQIVGDMKEHGFDPTKPIAVWRERNVVLDGHTRRQAAIEAGILDVPVAFISFESEDAALLYAVASQLNRRNLSQPEILCAVRVVDQVKKGGRPSKEKLAPVDANSHVGKSASATAKILGVSTKMVERSRVVLKDEEATQAVMEGRTSIRAAADQAKARKPTKQRTTRADKTAALASAPPLPFAEQAEQPLFPGVSGKPRYDNHQYRMDVRLYHEAKPLLDQLAELLQRVAGMKRSDHLGPLFQKMSSLAFVADPKYWVDCSRCKATGRKNGAQCGACRSYRYKVQ